MNSLTLSYPKTIEELSPSQIAEVYRHVKFDEYKVQLKGKIKQLEFDLEEKTVRWLKSKADHTSRMYKLYLNEFIEYLGDKSILEVDNYFVDKYVSDVIIPYGEGKGRVVFASLSSFYSSLYLWGDVDRNPFKGIVLKFPEEIKEDFHLITEEELEYIKMCFDTNRESHRKMRLAIHIMSKYGVRVGFFDGCKLVGNIIKSISKGKVYSINVENDREILDNLDILGAINSKTVQSTFRNVVEKLFADGVIDHKYTPHVLRHFFAVNEYKRDKDIYKLSRRLNHSTIRITANYLKGLGYE